MVKIQDVARHAAVSVTSVSNAINGKTDQMRKETLARIEAAIAELGFRPNHAARQLKTGQAAILGLLVPSIVNPSFAALARAVDMAAQRSYGYRVLLGNTYRLEENEKTFLGDLQSHGVQGVIVVAAQIEQAHFRTALQAGVAMVNYDGRSPARSADVGLSMDSVSMNNVEAGRIAARHLIARGCRHIAIVTESGRNASRSDKIEGFLTEAQGAGVNATIIEDRAVAESGDSEMAELGRALAERISGMAERPQGLVAINDMLAIGMLAGFRNSGVRVPGDISIVGIDDILLSSLVTPAITSVSPPIPVMAQLMVDRLISRIADPDMPTQEFLFTPKLVCRASVADAPATI
ncbi:MAG: LacI family DNA-binding transcriptional regulator [Rhodocyclaceae bacterium]